MLHGSEEPIWFEEDSRYQQTKGYFRHFSGVLNILEDSQQPFYVQWISKDHPSSDGNANADISELIICGESGKILKPLENLGKIFLSKIKVVSPQEQQVGLKSVEFNVNGSKVIIE